MKGKKTDLSAFNCGIARALQVVGDRWTLLLVRDAFLGLQRFGEFQKNLGLARNVLSARLKKLVEDGVFDILPDPESAASHRYVLTKRGEKLYLVVIALWQWGADNCFVPGELKSELVDNQDSRPLPKLKLVSTSGKELGPREFRMRPKGRAAALPRA